MLSYIFQNFLPCVLKVGHKTHFAHNLGAVALLVLCVG